MRSWRDLAQAPPDDVHEVNGHSCSRLSRSNRHRRRNSLALLGHRWLESTQIYVAANDRQVAADYYAACQKLEGWQ